MLTTAAGMDFGFVQTDSYIWLKKKHINSDVYKPLFLWNAFQVFFYDTEFDA